MPTSARDGTSVLLQTISKHALRRRGWALDERPYGANFNVCQMHTIIIHYSLFIIHHSLFTIHALPTPLYHVSSSSGRNVAVMAEIS